MYSTAGTTVTQNFDSLTGPNNTDVAWANNSTLSGWSLFNRNGDAISTTYRIGDGSSNQGAFYSFGTNGNTDRAFGGTASGGAYFGSPGQNTLAGHWAVAFTNNTGAALDSFTVSFDGEQWRNGGNTTAQSVIFEYGTGSTFSGVSTWTAGGAGFNFTSLVNTATVAALNGNLAANRTAGLGGTVSLSVANGSKLWLRWREFNDSGNDHGMGIDNFSFSATAVPEPTSMVLVGLMGAAGIAVRARRRLAKKA